MKAPELNYVALAARDTDAVRRFLGTALGLEHRTGVLGAQSVAVFGCGATALAVFAAGGAGLDAPVSPGVHHMALASTSPRADARRFGLAVASEGVGLDGGRFAALDPASTGGIRTRLAEPVAVPPPAPLVTRIDHLGIATDDNAGCVAAFNGKLGCPLESAQTDIEVRHVTESFVSDRYGAVYHAREPEVLGGLRTVFIGLGECELEIMMDYDSTLGPQASLGEQAGNTKGDQSAIARFVARRGPGLAHVGLRTPDIDAVLGKLAADGWRLIDHVGRPGGRGSRIGFVHPSNFGGGLLLHFVEF